MANDSFLTRLALFLEYGMGLLSYVLCNVVCEGQPAGDWRQEVLRGAEASGDLAVFYVVSKEGTEVKASGLQGFIKQSWLSYSTF